MKKQQTYFVILLCSALILIFAESVFSQDTINQLIVPPDNDFLHLLLNGLSIYQLLIFLIYGYVGIISNIISDYIRRKDKQRSFSFGYWVTSNKERVVVSILILPIMIIGFEQLFDITLNNINAFFLGTASDHFSEILKRKDVIRKWFLNMRFMSIIENAISGGEKKSSKRLMAYILLPVLILQLLGVFIFCLIYLLSDNELQKDIVSIERFYLDAILYCGGIILTLLGITGIEKFRPSHKDTSPKDEI